LDRYNVVLFVGLDSVNMRAIQAVLGGGSLIPYLYRYCHRICSRHVPPLPDPKSKRNKERSRIIECGVGQYYGTDSVIGSAQSLTDIQVE